MKEDYLNVLCLALLLMFFILLIMAGIQLRGLSL